MVSISNLFARAFAVVLIILTQGVTAQSFTNFSESLPKVATLPHNSMDAAVGDIDGDGDLDIVVGVEFLKNYILLNDGKGNFVDGSHLLPDKKSELDQKPYAYYPYHDTEDIALKDFDNDGDLDLLFVTEDDRKNELYINKGNGEFKDDSSDFPVTGISNAVIAEDFDNDGFMDIMIGNRGQNFYLRNQGGTFVDETFHRIPSRDDITQDLEAYDFDNDGDLDVIVGNEKENYLLLNNGKGFFEDATDKFIDPGFQVSGETREADFADVNGDGLVDIFFGNVFMFQQTKPVQRFLINSPTGFQDETEARIGFVDTKSVIDVDFYDIDNDLDQDLLLVTFAGPVLMLNDGKGFFKDITYQALGEIKSMGVDAEIADFNGDGKADVFFANFQSGDMLLIQK